MTALGAVAGIASASFNVSEWNGVLEGADQYGSFAPAEGDYRVASVLFSTAGAGFALTGVTNANFAVNPSQVGNTLGAASAPAFSSAVQTIGGLGYLLQITLSSAGDLAPAGFTVGGAPATNAGFFVGANAGGPSVNIPGGAQVIQATFEYFNLAGESQGLFNITSFAPFTAGPDGTWNGNLGLNLGAGSAGGIGSMRLEVLYVPAPGAIALLGMAGLLGSRRRR
jgi:hypothetical protein